MVRDEMVRPLLSSSTLRPGAPKVVQCCHGFSGPPVRAVTLRKTAGDEAQIWLQEFSVFTLLILALEHSRGLAARGCPAAARAAACLRGAEMERLTALRCP